MPKPAPFHFHSRFHPRFNSQRPARSPFAFTSGAFTPDDFPPETFNSTTFTPFASQLTALKQAFKQSALNPAFKLPAFRLPVFKTPALNLPAFASFALTLVLFLSGASKLFAQNSVPLLDISGETCRQVVVAQGTPEVYQGHPYAVLLPDRKTIFTVWCLNHGGFAGPIAKSEDAGLTWTRLDDRMPKGYWSHKNCPSIYRLVNADNQAFLWVFTSQPMMARIVSADDGETWEEKAPLGFPNVMAFSTIIPKNPGIQDGKYLGFYHVRIDSEKNILNLEPRVPNGSLAVMMSETSDAGFTWSKPVMIADVDGKDPCEPCAFWSPDQKEICVLMRENRGAGAQSRSLQAFSRDAGKTWTTPEETSWELTGHRHIGTYADDGRLVVAFRDVAPGSPSNGSFVAWVGSYDDLRQKKPGQYRAKILHNYSGWDCGYPGVLNTDGGVIVALTYLKYRPDENKHSVVAARFKLEELDERAKK